MSIFSEHADAMESVEAEMPQTATIAGTEYPCTVGFVHKGNDPTEGGTWLTAVGSLTVRRSLLAAIPREGNAILVGGVAYIAVSVSDQSDIPFVKIQFGKTPKP